MKRLGRVQEALCKVQEICWYWRIFLCYILQCCKLTTPEIKTYWKYLVTVTQRQYLQLKSVSLRSKNGWVNIVLYTAVMHYGCECMHDNKFLFFWLEKQKAWCTCSYVDGLETWMTYTSFILSWLQPQRPPSMSCKCKNQININCLDLSMMNKTNASLFTILYISQNNSSITVTWNCKCECIDNATKEIKKPLAGWSKYYRSLPCRVSG